jgi:hypothetical protein
MYNSVYTIPKDSAFSLMICKINQHWFCCIVALVDHKPLFLMSVGKYFAKQLNFPYVRLLIQNIPSKLRNEYFFNRFCEYEAYDLTPKQVELFFGILKAYAEINNLILSGWVPQFLGDNIQLNHFHDIRFSTIISMQNPELFKSFSQIYWGNTCRDSMVQFAEFLLEQALTIKSYPRFGNLGVNINYQFHHLRALDNIPRNSLILRRHPKQPHISQVFYKYRQHATWLLDYKQDKSIDSLFDSPFDTPDGYKLTMLLKKEHKEFIYSLPPKAKEVFLELIYQRLEAIACSSQKSRLSYEKFMCLKRFYSDLQEQNIRSQDELKIYSLKFTQSHQELLFKHRGLSIFNPFFKTKTQQLFEKLQGKPSILYAFFSWLYQIIKALCQHLTVLVTTPNIVP